MKNLTIVTAQWCDPCNKLKAVITENRKQLEQLAKITEISIGTEDQTLCLKTTITVIPTLLIVDDFGGELHRKTGFIEYEQLKRWLE